MKLIFLPILPLALPLAPYPVPWIEPTKPDKPEPDKRTDELRTERCSKTLN